MTKEQLLNALKWALASGVKAQNYGFGTGFFNRGCGCCSGDEEPPAEIDATVREVRRMLIEEKKI